MTYLYAEKTISPYILAARENTNPEVLRVLEEAGAQADKNEALKFAALSGNTEVIKFLIQNGATNQDSALIKFLLQNGSTDKDKNNVLEAAARQGNAEAVEFLVQNGANDKDIALELAANHGHAKVVSFLIGNGANVKDWHKFWRNSSWSIREVIAVYKPQVHEQEIINILKRYGFEIVADKNKFMRLTGFSEKIIAEEESSSGCVYFCTDSICIAEGYFFFRPDSFYVHKYSEFSSEDQIRSWLSLELSDSLLDRTVNALLDSIIRR